MNWEGVAVVITAIGTIVALFLNYNQHTRNKETDYRIARREAEDKEKRKADKIASQHIYRELWSLLHDITGALRVYVIQPHPLDRAKFISVQYEVVSEGMISVIPLVYRMPIGSLPGFVVELESKDYLYWQSQAEVKDGRARSIMHNIGTDKMMAVRMAEDGVWKGNIVVDLDNGTVNEVDVRERLVEARTIIQYMLPEIEE